MSIPTRLQKVRKLMSIQGLDSLLVSSREDIFYYTGYKTPEGNLLVIQNSGSPSLFVSPLDNDAEKVKGINLTYFKKGEDLTKLLKSQNVGYDENNLVARRFLNLHKHQIRLKKSSALIKQPREIKDDQEIESIKKAISITKNVLEKTNFYNRKEIDVANKIEAQFKLHGSDKSFDTIVCNGSASIHHIPDSTKIKSSRPTIFDLGARYNWYCCDVTRTYLGASGKYWKKIWEDVKEMQDEITEFVKPGITMEELQSIYIKLSGKKKYKVHHYFGHGLGLGVHEQITGKLKENMVITVEPGVYLNSGSHKSLANSSGSMFCSAGGVRIEDTILVRKGRPIVLSKSIKY